METKSTFPFEKVPMPIHARHRLLFTILPDPSKC
jgi:hypothetical protein